MILDWILNQMGGREGIKDIYWDNCLNRNMACTLNNSVKNS